MPIKFSVYDSEFDNVRPEHPPIEVYDPMVIESLRSYLDVPLGWMRGGRDAEDVLGRVLVALALLPEVSESPHVTAVFQALSNLADMATDAHHGSFIVAWA
jgi:hypothetical protein